MIQICLKVTVKFLCYIKKTTSPVLQMIFQFALSHQSFHFWSCDIKCHMAVVFSLNPAEIRCNLNRARCSHTQSNMFYWVCIHVIDLPLEVNIEGNYGRHEDLKCLNHLNKSLLSVWTQLHSLLYVCAEVKPSSNLWTSALKPSRKCKNLQFLNWPLEDGCKNESVPVRPHVQMANMFKAWFNFVFWFFFGPYFISPVMITMQGFNLHITHSFI